MPPSKINKIPEQNLNNKNKTTNKIESGSKVIRRGSYIPQNHLTLFVQKP